MKTGVFEILRNLMIYLNTVRNDFINNFYYYAAVRYGPSFSRTFKKIAFEYKIDY